MEKFKKIIKLLRIFKNFEKILKWRLKEKISSNFEDMCGQVLESLKEIMD